MALLKRHEDGHPLRLGVLRRSDVRMMSYEYHMEYQLGTFMGYELVHVNTT